jgi:hypothetical protein
MLSKRLVGHAKGNPQGVGALTRPDIYDFHVMPTPLA